MLISSFTHWSSQDSFEEQREAQQGEGQQSQGGCPSVSAGVVISSPCDFDMVIGRLRYESPSEDGSMATWCGFTGKDMDIFNKDELTRNGQFCGSAGSSVEKRTSSCSSSRVPCVVPSIICSDLWNGHYNVSSQNTSQDASEKWPQLIPDSGSCNNDGTWNSSSDSEMLAYDAPTTLRSLAS